MTSVSERLVLQLVKLRQREGELEREKTLLREREELQESLQRRVDQMQEQLQKVETVRSTLEKLNEAEEEKYVQARRDDELERGRLSESLQVAIEAVNAYSEEVVQLEAKAKHENKSLKDQLEIYAKYHASGNDKYQEIMRAREAEYAKIKVKRDAEEARKPQVEKELEEEMKLLEKVRDENSKLKEKMNGWLTYVAEVQERLMKAKGSFETAKRERERHMRRISSAESDRKLMVSRANKSKVECEKEHAKVLLLEEKINAQKKQTNKILAVIAMLDGKGGENQEMNEKN